jgi:transposase
MLILLPALSAHDGMRLNKPYSLQSHSNQESLHRKAVREHLRGRPITHIAEDLGVSRQAVYNWIEANERDPDHGLDHRPRGPRRSLTPEQCQRLRTLLLQGAVAQGYPNQLWTLPRVAAVIQKHFGVRYTPSGVWHVLRRDLDFSCQRPERRSHERDDGAMARWKRRFFRRLKLKMPPTGENPRVS